MEVVNFIGNITTTDGKKWKAGFTAKTWLGVKRQVSSFYQDKEYYTVLLNKVGTNEFSYRTKGKWYDLNIDKDLNVNKK